MTKKFRQGHLEYYKQHNIAPVSYNISRMEAHLQRRKSLYNMLGLIPLSFRDSKVLEIAAGTGHNSLYPASLLPQKLVLLEPNPAALNYIQAAYDNFRLAHTKPTVITNMLEEYHTDDLFDIVLCENWLGTSPHEKDLLLKLAEFVVPEGVLVVTFLSPIGFVPNLLRRFLVTYLVPIEMDFDAKTKILEKAFKAHLATLPSMTRSITDWIHDNMLNPAYFGLCLSAPEIISLLGDKFDVERSYPSFEEEWRWFKGLCGETRQRNSHFLGEYWTKCHNYLDSSAETFASEPECNKKLESLALDILKAIEIHEDVYLQNGDTSEAAKIVFLAYQSFLRIVPAKLTNAIAAFEELLPLLQQTNLISAESVSSLRKFNSLFGRETSYISLMKHNNG